MAGRGPAPKARRLGHGSTRDERTVSPRSAPVEAPALGKSYRVREYRDGRPVDRRRDYLSETRRWYDAWREHPLADEFSAVAWARLQIVARLVDRLHRGELSPSLAAEVRVSESAFGGSPMDLRRLGVKLSKQPSPAGRDELQSVRERRDLADRMMGVRT